jgi:transcriptional regulator with XRE-family HTH domain
MIRLPRPALDLLTKHAARPIARPSELSARLRVKHSWKPIAQALKQHIAHRLTMLRRCHGMTQTEIAALCGLNIQQFAKYEHGLCRLPPDRMWLIATCFSIDIAYFFDDFDPSEIIPRSPPPPRDGNAANRLKIATALEGITSTRKLQSLIGMIQAIADAPDGA